MTWNSEILSLFELVLDEYNPLVKLNEGKTIKSGESWVLKLSITLE